jgi:hypothetical protein
MRRGSVLMKLGLFALILVQAVFAVDVSKFKVAVFWNDSTTIVPFETPVGYQGVGGGDGTEAMAIGKSGLKMFLTSMDSRVGYNPSTTLDNSDVKEELTDDSGVMTSGSTVILPNVRIYKATDVDVLFDTVKAHFDDQLPDAIVVINGGGEVENPALHQLLYEASDAEVGVFLIGSSSTAFAVAIDDIAVANDKNKFFAVKGIQEAFRAEGYSGSILSDFDFIGDIKQDTVVLDYVETDAIDYHSIIAVTDVHYEGVNDKYTYKLADTLYHTEMNKSTNAFTEVTDKIHPAINVKSYYGQFSITGAKAQSVIQYDSYDPAMNAGIYYAEATLHDNNGKLEVANGNSNGANYGGDVVVSDPIKADVIPNYSGNVINPGDLIKEAEHVSGHTFKFKEDFIINNAVIYSKDDVIEWEQYYTIRYPSTGYTNLTIDVKDLDKNGNKEIYEKIFTNGVSKLPAKDTSLTFKKWEDNGRIQAAAEIWAVDQNAGDGGIAQFSEWYGTGGSYDPKKYYFARFAQQVAKGTDQFYYNEENPGKWGFDQVKFSALPNSSDDFKNK